MPSAGSASLELPDTLGQVVHRYAVALATAGSQELNLAELVTGMYAPRLTAGSTTATRRQLVE